MRWIEDRGDGDRPREFRIDLQLAGEGTVLMNRWEKATWAPPGNGFGFSFEEETTVPAIGCEKNTGHHRIVQYVCAQIFVPVLITQLSALLSFLEIRRADHGGQIRGRRMP